MVARLKSHSQDAGMTAVTAACLGQGVYTTFVTNLVE